MQYIDLHNDTLKTFGTHFVYDDKLKKGTKILQDRKRYSISMKVWKMRNLNARGKNCYL